MKDLKETKEELTKFAHKQWSGWMEYLFSKGKFNADGTWTMPAWAVDRWSRQMQTQYDDLPLNEKESDKEEAERMLSIIKYQQIIEALEELYILKHGPDEDLGNYYKDK